MEADLCIRSYFNSKQQCRDVLMLLNEDNRPVFSDDLSEGNKKIFDVLEYSESPDTAQLCSDNSLYANWFIGTEESIDEIIDNLLQCGATSLYILVDADDYCEFYKKVEGTEIILTREFEKSELTDDEIDLPSKELLRLEFDLASC